jgi:hypothetical protein
LKLAPGIHPAAVDLITEGALPDFRCTFSACTVSTRNRLSTTAGKIRRVILHNICVFFHSNSLCAQRDLEGESDTQTDHSGEL